MNRLHRMLRQHNQYTCHEIVAAVFEYATGRRWPDRDLPTVLAHFDDEALAIMGTDAAGLLAELGKETVGIRLGYATTEDGGGDRLLKSDVIPRRFIIELSQFE